MSLKTLSKIVEVEMSSIEISPFQPRKHFSMEELEELAQSIKTIGLLQPPVVRQLSSSNEKPTYELIAGERRMRAARMAGLQRIPVILVEPSDELAAEASLIENVQRVDLNPLEIAKAFQQLIEIFHLTQEEVAEKVGKKRSTVANYLRLLSLSPTLKEALNNGSISMGHAKSLLSLENKELQESLLRSILRDHLTVRETEKEVHTLLKRSSISKPLKTDHEEQLRVYQCRLEEKFGTKVKINLIKEKGTVSFDFYSLDDFERLLTLMDASVFME